MAFNPPIAARKEGARLIGLPRISLGIAKKLSDILTKGVQSTIGQAVREGGDPKGKGFSGA